MVPVPRAVNELVGARQRCGGKARVEGESVGRLAAVELQRQRLQGGGDALPVVQGALQCGGDAVAIACQFQITRNDGQPAVAA